ncbi:MAG: hypothetical protein NWE93_11345 [Candidatus Bathyarchaeota archaeon]|nr:hypothetical protein [Candidatus Bathyarchaeota archaeon]
MTATAQQTETTSPILNKLLNAEKTAINEARQQWYKEREQAEKAEEPSILLNHINDIENPQYIGKTVTVPGIVSSNSISYPIPAEIAADKLIKTSGPDGEYENYPTSTTINPKDPINLALIDIALEAQERRLKRLFMDENCKVTNLRIKKYRTAYLIRVRPPVQAIKQDGNKQIDEQGREYKHYDIYIVTEKPLTFQSSTKINLTGIPLPNPKTQRTTLLAYKVEFPEATEHFNISALTQLKNKFDCLSMQERWNWVLDNAELYTQIIGRRNVAAAVYLTYFSPLRVELYNDIQHGWGLADIIGDSTTGKSETVKKIARSLNAGMVISAETASIAGVIGAVSQMENGAWFVDWGYLPLMDCKLLAMDGCHKIPPWEWAKTAEAERDGILNISKAAKAIVPAHTRQIKIYNALDKETPGYPTKQLSDFLYPAQAYPTIADPTTIARRDLAVFVDSRDVPPEKINQIPTTQPEPEYTLLSESLRWCWSNTTTVVFTNDALSYLLSKATELYNTFYYAPIPLVSADMKFKLARLSIAAANMTLSTDDYETVTVTLEHVDLIVKFLTEEYSKAGLNILAQKHRFEKLSPDDVEALVKQIEEKLSRAPIERSKLIAILDDFVTTGYTTKDHLKNTYDLTEKNQLIPLVAALVSTGLARGGRGYFSTNKLIEAYKVTNNFATLAILATPQTDTPHNTLLNSKTHSSFTSYNADSNTTENGVGGIILEHSKDGKDGKETILYRRINPYMETQTCHRCQAVQAEVKMTSNKGSGQTYYSCQNCFNMYRFENEPQGVKFVEDQPELPPYPEEPPIPA